jgi:uncharacterized protein YabN with tetrapyrrole methylase and pyrophosphatase domain
MTKDYYIFGHISNFYLVIKFQNCGSEHNHGLLWIKDAPMYGVHTNEEIEQFVDMYISCDISCTNSLHNAQKINTCIHVRRKNNVGCKWDNINCTHLLLRLLLEKYF